MTALDDNVFLNAYEGKTTVVMEAVSRREEYLKKTDTSRRLLIHWAALSGQVDLVSFLLSKGQDIDARDDINMTPLILAASAGRLPIVKLLIENGADVNAKNGGGHTALQYAASKGWREIVELLLNADADINVKDNQGATPLHRAASKGVTPIVSMFLNSRLTPDVDAKDATGNTPLHLACEENREEEVKLLIKNGASITTLNEEKKTPLQMASNSFLEVLRKNEIIQ